MNDDGNLHVMMFDHSHEKYIPTEPKKTVEESQNSSNRYFYTTVLLSFNFKNPLYDPIYSCATEIVDIEASTKISSDNNFIDKAAARVRVPLVPGVPTTSLRIKLLDGTKLIAKFNHTHTVGDIRRYIKAYPFKYYCIYKCFDELIVI